MVYAIDVEIMWQNVTICSALLTYVKSLKYRALSRFDWQLISDQLHRVSSMISNRHDNMNTIFLGRTIKEVRVCMFVLVFALQWRSAQVLNQRSEVIFGKWGHFGRFTLCSGFLRVKTKDATILNIILSHTVRHPRFKAHFEIAVFRYCISFM